MCRAAKDGAIELLEHDYNTGTSGVLQGGMLDCIGTEHKYKLHQVAKKDGTKAWLDMSSLAKELDVPIESTIKSFTR